MMLMLIVANTVTWAGTPYSQVSIPDSQVGTPDSEAGTSVSGGGIVYNLDNQHHISTIEGSYTQHRISAVEGSDSSAVYSETFHLYYKVNSNDIDPNYLNNAALIDRIIEHFRNSPRIDSVIVYSYASPEGSFSRNKYLAQKRAEAAKHFILRNLPDTSALSKDNIIMRPVPENWAGLRDIIEQAYTRPDRQTVLDILDDTSISDETRKARLKKLDSGRTWKYILNECMPHLRYATWVCVWVPLPPEREEIEPLALTAIPEDRLVQNFTAPEPQINYTTREQWRTILAIKTNMLYDAATMLNFSVEAPINEHFSVQYQHYCPWWHNGAKSAMQFLYMGGEGRWWFIPKTRDWYHPDVLSGKRKQRDALMGHYVGLYGAGGKFDVQYRDKLGMYQCYFWSVGASYGFSMPISRYLNLEFSLSVGYANVDYQGYHPAQDWSVLFRDKTKTGTLHYFGPTKAEVSLVIPFRVRTKKAEGGAGL